MWKATDISPERLQENGLYVIKEHVLEDHISAFETAIDKHEVELMNELRCIKGKPLIDNKSCVVVNDLVYTTGGRACFPCIMETHQGNKYVSVFIHMNKSCRGHCTNNKTLMVECVATGAIIMKNPANEVRFYPGTSPYKIHPCASRVRGNESGWGKAMPASHLPPLVGICAREHRCGRSLIHRDGALHDHGPRAKELGSRCSEICSTKTQAA
jgi:hypothetical protein